MLEAAVEAHLYTLKAIISKFLCCQLCPLSDVYLFYFNQRRPVPVNMFAKASMGSFYINNYLHLVWNIAWFQKERTHKGGGNLDLSATSV